MPFRSGLKILVTVILSGVLAFGCDAESAPEPGEQEATTRAVPEEPIDSIHVARTKSDRSIYITNVALVLKRDPTDPERMGVTLASTRPGDDGARMVFGSYEPTQSIDKLAAGEIYLTSGSFLNLKGNGIFTRTAVYQPKFASLKIQSFDKKEVHGTIEGDFYRFAAATGFTSPSTQKLELHFDAVRVED